MLALAKGCGDMLRFCDRNARGITGTILILAVSVIAVERAAADAPTSNTDQTAVDQAVRATAKEFVEAFNRGDAQSLAGLWTPDGDYADESGKTIQGRAAIEKQYANFFSEHPDAKMELNVTSVRLLGNDTALEDGESRVTSAAEKTSGAGRYTAVHVRRDGRWQMASVREFALPSAAEPLGMKDFGWLVGKWVAEREGNEIELEVRPIIDGRFFELVFAVRKSDKTIESGHQITGVDPASGHLSSWTFNSDGSLAHGIWQPGEKGWAGSFEGISAAGAPTTAVNTISKLDENAFAWKSIHRTLAGRPLPDTDEVVVRRAPR